MLRLHQNGASPFARMVKVLLHEAEMTDRVEMVEALGTPLEPGSLPVGQNPLGKIPTLERADEAGEFSPLKRGTADSAPAGKSRPAQ